MGCLAERTGLSGWRTVCSYFDGPQMSRSRVGGVTDSGGPRPSRRTRNDANHLGEAKRFPWTLGWPLDSRSAIYRREYSAHRWRFVNQRAVHCLHLRQSSPRTIADPLRNVDLGDSFAVRAHDGHHLGRLHLMAGEPDPEVSDSLTAKAAANPQAYRRLSLCSPGRLRHRGDPQRHERNPAVRDNLVIVAAMR